MRRCRSRSRHASTDETTGLGRLRQLGACRRRGRCRPPRVSGIYIAQARSRRQRGGPATSCSSFATTSATRDLLFQTSDTTWQAYNRYGGNSLYDGLAGRSRLQGELQPAVHHARVQCRRDWLFNAEYPMVRWLEAQWLRRQLHHRRRFRSPRRELLEHTRVFLSVGHDEYWSGGQRANVEAARAAGVNLAFFSGNEVFWKTRWENSIAAAAHAHRTLVSLQGDARQRQDRSAAGRVDRHVARPALQAAG